MKFLVIFLVWILLIKLPLPVRNVQSQGFARYLKFCNGLGVFRALPIALQYLVLVVVPTLAVLAVFCYLNPIAWGLPALLLEIMLVLYVLMHADVQRHINNYQERVAKEDFQGAFLCAEQSLGIDLDEGTEVTAEAVSQAVVKTLLYRWFQCLFLMLFWYVIADVGGLVLVWLSLQLAKHSTADSVAAKILHWLEAIPVRLLALTYGLAGNLVRALPIWNRTLLDWRQPHSELLYQVASSAVDDVQVKGEVSPEWQRLHRYSVSIWLVVIAVATLGGWLL